MKRIDLEEKEWYDESTGQNWMTLKRDRDIAKSINAIMDYLENDLKSMVEKEIESRFEILDL